mmetsp:Transcript_6079/g.20508  ORF Transcript_6079/g.20508 Transcript_6079/m.20508 type:complete len:171 (+) Transcript_6079:307-819(+)
MGVDKKEFFTALQEQRHPGEGDEVRLQKIQMLKKAWRAEGLTLSLGEGARIGSSFDAQRLLLLAREQGCEDAMIEAVYETNHLFDLPLSSHAALLAAAERAGVRGAADALRGDYGRAEVTQRIGSYYAMGISAVPVCILNEQFPIGGGGAPEKAAIARAFESLIARGTVV